MFVFLSQSMTAKHDVLDDCITAKEYSLLRLCGYFSDDEILALMLAEAADIQEATPYHRRFSRFDLEQYSDEECRHTFDSKRPTFWCYVPCWVFLLCTGLQEIALCGLG